MIRFPLSTRHFSLGRIRMIVLAVALCLLAAPATSQAQALRLFLSDQAVEPTRQIEVPRLRPNVKQQLYLFLDGGEGQKGKVTVQFIAGGKPIAGAVKEMDLGAKGPQRVDFPLAKPLAPGEKPVPPPEVDGGRLRVVVLKDGKPLAEPSMEIEVGRPSGYVQTELDDFKPASGRLSLAVRATDQFFGPRCRVELDLRPQLVPFMQPKQKQNGSYGGYLNQPNDRVELAAEGIRFNDTGDAGLFSVVVDGYQRAFTYGISREGGRPFALEGAAIRLVADPSAASGPAAKVGIEADNVPNDAVIEVGLYRDQQFTKLEGDLLRFSGDRRQRMFFAPGGANGALTFVTDVSDWTTGIETAKIFGDRYLRLRLLNRETGKPLEFTQIGPRGQTNKVMFISSTMVLDGSPPEDVKFVDFPKELTRGSPLTLKATGRDPESGIGKVVFFAGKLPENGVIPPTAIQAPGEAIKDKGVWVAELQVPTDKAATLDVGVQFTNKVGQTETAVAVVKLVDAKPVGATIKGEVVEGERAQAGLDVLLRDPQGTVKDTSKTDAAGKFVFKNVAPGTYQLVVVKSSSMRTGQAAVKVEAGEEKELKDPIKLVR